MNRYALARSLQLLGLVVAPMGIAAELNDQVSLGESLLIASIGALIFYAGHALQSRKS